MLFKRNSDQKPIHNLTTTQHSESEETAQSSDRLQQLYERIAQGQALAEIENQARRKRH